MFTDFLTVVSDLAEQFSLFVESLPYAPGMELGDSLVNLGFNLIYAGGICTVIILPFLLVAFVIKSIFRGFN